MHGWLLTIAIFTLQPTPTSPPAAAEPTEMVVDASGLGAGQIEAKNHGGPTAPDSAVAPARAPEATELATELAPKIDPEGTRIALEYRANRAFESGDYWKATTIWARLAAREQPSKARDGYVLRAVSAANLMFDEYGERRALCLGHRILSTHLRAGRSEGQQYFVNRRRELTTKLVDHLGERWPHACRQLLRESSFGETPPTPVVRIQSNRPAPVPALPEGDEASCDPPKDPTSSCAGFSQPPLDDRPKRRPILIAGATLTSLGTATLMATVTSGIFYKQRQLELGVLAQNEAKSPLTPAELELVANNVESAARLKKVMLGTGIVGGAQLIAGVVMLAVDAGQQRQQRTRQVAVTPVVSPGLAGWVLSGSF